METKEIMDEPQDEVVYFQLQDLLAVGMTLVVLGIGIAYGLNVMADVRDDFTAGTAERNATTDAITAIAKIPSKLGLIVTVVLAAIIIGILVRYLFVRFA